MAGAMRLRRQCGHGGKRSPTGFLHLARPARFAHPGEVELSSRSPGLLSAWGDSPVLAMAARPRRGRERAHRGHRRSRTPSTSEAKVEAVRVRAPMSGVVGRLEPPLGSSRYGNTGTVLAHPWRDKQGRGGMVNCLPWWRRGGDRSTGRHEAVTW
jgi:hypothetical protein